MNAVIKWTTVVALILSGEFIHAQTSIPFPHVFGQATNLPPSILDSTNQLLQLPHSVPLLAQPKPPFDSEALGNSRPLKPGVYQTYPYACLVKVPEPTHDDCLIHLPTNTNSSAQIINPSLRFVPVPPKTK